jgi:hypothetical protein
MRPGCSLTGSGDLATLCSLHAAPMLLPVDISTH